MGATGVQLHLSLTSVGWSTKWEDQSSTVRELSSRAKFLSRSASLSNENVSFNHSISQNSRRSLIIRLAKPSMGERQLRRVISNVLDPEKKIEQMPEANDESVKNVGWDRRGGWLGVDVPNRENNIIPSDIESSENGKRSVGSQRLLVVANRLPVSAKRKGDEWSLEMSTGGLVSALLGVKQFETVWIGWAGVSVPDDVGRKALTNALEEKGCIPVFLDDEIADQYYNGYCNNVLWPLFHYLGLPQEDRLSATHSLEDQFEAYKRANSMFAKVVCENYKEGDVIWCHDYHLMFLPKILKDYDRNMKVGWFLHIPFPSSEIYRTLPSRSELLKAVLSADLVGFHTYDYARHFVSACTRILGLEGTPEGVEDEGKLTRVAAFPIGIDPERFIDAIETVEVKRNIQELKEELAGRKVMLGVYRLDTIKGIPQKLLAFEKFLEENVEWRDKVVLVQLAVPTRTDVPEYQRLTSQVHEIVGRINGRFGTLTNVPIHHLDRLLEFPKLCALYAIADVLLVTSLRDGMNLVCYEFISCQNNNKGVLVLSEFAGAAQSLGAGAVLVNPWNISDVAIAIKDALDMPIPEREECQQHNFEHVITHTAQAWADAFVSELNDTIVEAELRRLRIPRQLPVEEAVKKYQQAKNRLLILGFNATLATVESPRRRGHDKTKEMKLRLHPDLHGIFRDLCSDTKSTVVILSGSKRSILDEAFGQFNVWLAAENGMFLRHTSGEWMATTPKHLNMDWLESVKLVFDYFQERTPRSYVEVRETSLVWSYKYADMEFGRLQSRDMLQHLWTGPISNAALDVVQGGKTVEVRAVGITKGSTIDRVLGEIIHSKHMSTPFDYVLCMGHFAIKDEDIYSFFEPELSLKRKPNSNGRLLDAKALAERRLETKSAGMLTVKGTARLNAEGSRNFLESSVEHVGGYSKGTNKYGRLMEWPSYEELREQEGSSSMLDLKGENYYSCAVGRKRSNARYSLPSSEDAVLFLKEMAKSYNKIV